MTEEVKVCPVKNCNWSVTYAVPLFSLTEFPFLDIRKELETIEEILTEHIATHPRWRLNRKIRKAIARGKK